MLLFSLFVQLFGLFFVGLVWLFSFFDEFWALLIELVEDGVPECFITVLIDSSYFMKDNMDNIFITNIQHFFPDAILIIFQLGSDIFGSDLHFFMISFDIIIDVS